MLQSLESVRGSTFSFALWISAKIANCCKTLRDFSVEACHTTLSEAKVCARPPCFMFKPNDFNSKFKRVLPYVRYVGTGANSQLKLSRIS